MHEMSIARALLSLVERHAPPGAVVRVVHVEAGPLQAIEPQALDLAWQAITANTSLEASNLELSLIPWRIRCPACDLDWTTDDPLATCVCGNTQCQSTGSDALTLVGLDVAEPATAKEHSHASAHR